MKSTIIRRGASSLAITGICLVMFSACGSGAGDQVNSNGPAAVASSSPIPTIAGATNTGNALPPGETGKPATGNNNQPRAANAPGAKIGTGGSDFFVFTQARAALGADAELQGANITIDVKAGVLTLSGTVTNAAQQSKAEQLARAVSGVKAVKNQLRISN